MAAHSGEFLTCQFGHFANFVGAHFWNIQDELFQFDTNQQVVADVFYRVSERKGVLEYTPRTIIFDGKGSLGTLNRDDDVYCSGGPVSDTWAGVVEEHVTERVPKNDFLRSLDESEQVAETPGTEVPAVQPAAAAAGAAPLPKFDLESSVTVWSDFLRARLHSRSLHVLRDVEHENPNVPFDVYSQGASVMRREDEDEEVETRVHRFMEECDRLQGFQFFVDTNSGYGGFAQEFITRLRDDCERTPMLLFATHARHDWMLAGLDALQAPELHTLNLGMAMSSLTELVSCCMPFVCQNYESRFWQHSTPNMRLRYHVSGLIAPAVDAFTLPCRTAARSSHVAALLHDAVPSSALRVLALRHAFPLHATAAHGLSQLSAEAGPMYLLPHNVAAPLALEHRVNSETPAPWSEIVVARGIPDPTPHGDVDTRTALKTWADGNGATSRVCSYVDLRFPVPESFPAALVPSPSVCSAVTETDRGVISLPTLTHAYTSLAMHAPLNGLAEAFARVRKHRHPVFADCGVARDEWNEAHERLRTMADNYSGDIDFGA